MTISRLLQHNPSRPMSFATRDFGLWRLSRDDLVANMQREKISHALSTDRMVSDDEKNLSSDLVDFVKLKQCPMKDVVKHVARIFPCLIRALISGVGDFSILFCDPSSLVPLRIQAFASLLYVIHSLQTVLADHAHVQREFGYNTSDILCLLFDEQCILSGLDTCNFEDVTDLLKQFSCPQYCSSGCIQKAPSISDTSVSVTQYPFGSVKTYNVSTDAIRPFCDGGKRVVDSKYEFQAALKANTQNDDDIVLTKSEIIYQSTVNKRRWMTIPSSMLSTIKEDGDKCELDDEPIVRNMVCPSSTLSSSSYIMGKNEDKIVIHRTDPSTDEGEHVLNMQNGRTIDFGVKQMRIPSRISATDQNKDLILTDAWTKRIPLNDNELTAAGDSFLDSLG